MIEVKKLSAGYSKKNVLKDVSLQFPFGMITSIIGTNGSGKSTLLKQIAGILKHNSGEILIYDQHIQSIKRKKLAQLVGFLPQKAQAPEGLTVREVVELGRHPYQGLFKRNLKKDIEKIDFALEETDLIALSAKSFSSLSGGQQQRVWLAMILAQDTEVLLLDEPTTYLDIAHQNQLLDLLKNLNQKYNKTIIMVLHDINQVYQISDYVIGLKSGEVVISGYTQEVIHRQSIQQLFDVDSEFLCCGQGKRDYIVL
ncbi:ABC transporter ATP-binding protein [Thiotrichales bacterium 19S3-7]|nr:ABC transporter ATP-binding protein [Thiotrichales bacterium 19S3-7]MCF6802179.1 ABC transporter ATP-binding protein [Thiotrichales bacterium 19S3-11]